MTRSLHFSWELSGSGWATCRIWDSSTKHREGVSYCTNALADLLKGVSGLYGPHGIQRFSFDLEPAEARWILRRRNSDVHITIRRFPDMSTSFDAPDGKGTLVWTSTRPRTSMAHAVLMAAEKVRRVGPGLLAVKEGEEVERVRQSAPSGLAVASIEVEAGGAERVQVQALAGEDLLESGSGLGGAATGAGDQAPDGGLQTHPRPADCPDDARERRPVPAQHSPSVRPASRA
ncbi:hypothetical protein [Kitasatospora sp. NPDC002965]|uniref:hypothetical protein n=1 Tax=Kitasatospora sp. NPDC002965 TaxID=3154775 RepID=UPI0033AD3628